MKKEIIMAAAMGIIPLLAACGPATPLITVEPTEAPEVAVASPTVSSPATNTPTASSEEATQPAPEPAAAFPTPNPNPECVVEPIPEDPNIPPATADEWSKGPDDASVTLIEYGDFQ
jgi:hypothetical protein